MRKIYPVYFGKTEKRFAGKKVAVLIEMRSADNNVKISGFEFDLERLEQTMDFIEAHKSILAEKREYLRFHINEMILEGDVTNEFFRTLIINYLVTYETPSKLFKELPGQSLGFIMYINANETNDPKIGGMPYKEIEKLAVKIVA